MKTKCRKIAEFAVCAPGNGEKRTWSTTRGMNWMGVGERKREKKEGKRGMNAVKWTKRARQREGETKRTTQPGGNLKTFSSNDTILRHSPHVHRSTFICFIPGSRDHRIVKQRMKIIRVISSTNRIALVCLHFYTETRYITQICQFTMICSQTEEWYFSFPTLKSWYRDYERIIAANYFKCNLLKVLNNFWKSSYRNSGIEFHRKITRTF